MTPSRSFLLGVLSLVVSLSACDPKGSAGAIGAQPLGDDKQLAPRELPGPGGETPTIDPSIDPLHDPSPDAIDLQKTLPGIDDAPLPWKLRDPAAKGSCHCHLECGPRNDDGSKDCITICNDC